MKIPKKDIEGILLSVNNSGNQMINYTEFIAATIDLQNLLTDEKLWSLFDNFKDSEEEGQISAKSLQKAFGRLGIKKDDKEVKEILADHDIDNDGKLSFEEFKSIFIDDENIHEGRKERQASCLRMS